MMTISPSRKWSPNVSPIMDPPIVIALNKADLPVQIDQGYVLSKVPGASVVRISSRTGEGIAELEAALSRVITGEAMRNAAPALVTTRQRAALERALAHIRQVIEARTFDTPLDLLAIDVRAALRAIGEVTGEAIDDAVLTEIFSRFCIGK